MGERGCFVQINKSSIVLSDNTPVLFLHYSSFTLTGCDIHLVLILLQEFMSPFDCDMADEQMGPGK